MFKKLKRLIQAIRTCRDLGDGALDVQYSGDKAYWNPEADENWQKYSRARSQVSEWPRAERIARDMGLI